VQEVTARNERIICCGDRWVKWADLVMTCFIAHSLGLQSTYSSVNLNPDDFNSFTVLNMFTKWKDSRVHCFLLNLLRELRLCSSSGPRDKIYAIAGWHLISRKGRSCPIIPNHSKTSTWISPLVPSETSHRITSLIF
jgi:hypothetical protein